MTSNIKKCLGRPKKDVSELAKGTDKILCDLCNIYYSRYNKSKHIKTKLHIAKNDIFNALKHSILHFKDINTFDDIVKHQYVNKKTGNIVYMNKSQFNFYNKLSYNPYKLPKKNIDI